MSPRSLFVVVALAVPLGCHRPVESAPEPEQPVARSPEIVQQVIVAGRVVRDGAALSGVRVSYGLGDADADVSDEAGEFELVLTEDFARAPAIYLTLTAIDGQRFSGVLRNPGRPLSVNFELGETLHIEVNDASPEDQAWVDVHVWCMREADEWLSTPKDDHAAHLAQWTRVAEAIAAEPDELRRGLMTAAQFQIGRGKPELGLDRSAIALAALDELGLEDPRWSISAVVLASAVFESGRWAELAPRLDALITEHPQLEIAAYIALERYFQSSADGPAAEAEAVWQRWLDRPALARTEVGPIMASLSPKRALAAGQRLPELCVEDLASGQLCLADLRGRMVVLEIWSTWCQGCRNTAVKLRSAHAALTGDEAPLFVSIDAYDSPETLAAFLDEEPMPWRHGWVRESEREAFRQALDVESIPTLVLIDADGTILASTPELEAEHLLEQIDALRRGLD
jgi:peroxiredoxin